MLGKIASHLSKCKADHGIICIILSRARNFSGIGLKDHIDMRRLCENICKQSKIKRRMNEETPLVQLAQAALDKYFH